MILNRGFSSKLVMSQSMLDLFHYNFYCFLVKICLILFFLVRQKLLIKERNVCLVNFAARNVIEHGVVVTHGPTWDSSVKFVT